MEEKRELKVLAWRAARRDKLRGYAMLELPSGMRIADVPVFQDPKTGMVWALSPQKPLVRDARQLLDEWGKPAWAPVFTWRTRELRDRWGVWVAEKVRGAHPGDFDAPAAAAGNC